MRFIISLCSIFAWIFFGGCGPVAKPPGPLPDNSGMVKIEGGVFNMGSEHERANADEQPSHAVMVDDFWMDIHEVTNTEFQKFVEATGYRTTAEKWMDTPHEASGSLVFVPDPDGWWKSGTGADWRHPGGRETGIEGKEDHPVVNVSWEDATAFAKWCGKRLPTEAEWEFAARNRGAAVIFPWGNELLPGGLPQANYWQGDFPATNSMTDGFYRTAPAGSFSPNRCGLHDMAGNVWEWCSDYYAADYYQNIPASVMLKNPQGPAFAFDPEEPGVQKRVMRGGSFLCNDSYCFGYRTTARMKASQHSSFAHTGFRCVRDVK